MEKTIEEKIFDFELLGSIPENARAVLGRELDKMASGALRVMFQHPGMDPRPYITKLRERLAAIPSADPTPGKQDKWPMPQLDPTDIEILRMKMKDSDLQGKQIAQQKYWQPSDVSRRIKMLEKIGYIRHGAVTEAGEWYLDNVAHD